MLRLNRQEEADDGTFGALLLDGRVFCVTLEPPDRDNQQNISNIPPGVYPLRRVVSPKYGETFEICEVPSRAHVLLHAGNLVRHTRACVLVAQYWGKLKGNRAVLNSGATFRKLMDAMFGIDETTIDIRDPEV